MAGQYAVLKAAIEAVIKTNGNNEITGALMQQALLAMIASLGAYYDFVDVATPSTNPGTPDQNVMYFAATAGTYTNFGGIVVNEGEFCALCWNGLWIKKTTGAATEEQVTALSRKVDGLALGKFYGFFQAAADLPAGDDEGYAYVGESAPFAIYVFDGSSWSDSGSVYSYPVGNGEDINTNGAGQLQFANRPDTYGMGYKILRRDSTFASQVTDANTIYEIRYDFDLGMASVTIPAGCVLKFVGGKLSNGTIDFNNAKLTGCPRLDCQASKIGNEFVSYWWFEDFGNAIYAASNSDCLILDGGGITINQNSTITFGKDQNCSLQNFIINFTASANGQSLFLFDSDTIYRGSTNNIKNCQFVCTNPDAYNNVHCIHLRRWYNTVNSKIDNVVVNGFSGYMFICESYLQEMEFNRFKGRNVGGFFSLNKEFGTANAFGDYAFGKANILNFVNSGIDIGILTNNTITDLIDLSCVCEVTMTNCVWQGNSRSKTGINGLNIAKYISGNLRMNGRVVLTHCWWEFENLNSNIQGCVIGEDCFVDFNQSAPSKYYITGKHTTIKIFVGNALYSANVFDISADAYPTIYFLGKGKTETAFANIGSLFNEARVIMDFKEDETAQYNFTDIYVKRSGILDSFYALTQVTPLAANNVAFSMLKENNVDIFRQQPVSGDADTTYRFAVLDKDQIFNAAKGNKLLHLIYRLTPTIAVTSENINSFKFLANSPYVLVNPTGGATNVFVVGQSTTPSQNEWRELLIPLALANVQANGYYYTQGNLTKRNFIFDIAVSRIYLAEEHIMRDILINQKDHTQLVFNNQPQGNSFATSMRPAMANTANDIGKQIFDKTLGKPIWWTGSAWVDATGASV